MIPNSLIQSLQNIEGFDEKAFVEAHEINKQVISVRLNPAKTGNIKPEIISSLANEKVPWCTDAFYLQERPFFTHDPHLHAGLYYVQEASSMFLDSIIKQIYNEDRNKIVLDLCAAPGGKSTLLASYFTQGLIVSNEVIKTRANILSENITKWGPGNVVVTNNDSSHFEALDNFFDLVVVDAPCSGSGLFRKDKEAIQEWSVDNVNLCSQRQQRILSNIISCLKPEGVLIYSTCSYSKQENEDIVEWLINEFDFSTERIEAEKKWGIVEVSTLNNGWAYRFYPDKVKGEGFFVAVLKKKKSAVDKSRFKHQNLLQPSKYEADILSKLLKSTNELFYFKHNDSFKSFPLAFKNQLEIIQSYLYIKKAGIEIGMLKGKDLIPHHELAMSNLQYEEVSKVEVNKTEALQYLSKNEVILDTAFEGWVLLTYFNAPLGWIKKMKKRLNNYYPTEWRILNTDFNK